MPFDDFSFSPIALGVPEAPVLLPHVPSQLLRLALADLAKVEAMPERYRVDMNEYHVPQDTHCAVCFAGSVLAMSLGLSPDTNWENVPMGPNDHALFALNAFRNAHRPDHMRLACRYLSAILIPFSVSIPEYQEDRTAFHASMHALANAFAESGQ